MSALDWVVLFGLAATVAALYVWLVVLNPRD